MDPNEIQEANKEFGRMVAWLFLAIAFYVTAAIFASHGTDFYPQVQTVFQKLGNITSGAYLGYWIDRHSTRARLTEYSDPLLQVRRAIIIAAAILGISLGM